MSRGQPETEKSKYRSKPGFFHRFRALGERLIYSKNALWGIGVASFLEALVIPIPLETILIPLLQARRKQMFLICTIVMVGCLMAAAVGYGVGYFVFDSIGPQLVSLFATPEQFEDVRLRMEQTGFWFVFSVGIIPIPFQIAMLAAGATGYSFWMFMLASTLSRGVRYYGLAILVLIAGDRAQKIFERHKVTSSIIFLVIVLAIWGYSIFG